jgi:hypothetical protein
MQTIFEEISSQINEIRNFLASLDLKLEALDYQIIRSWEFFVSET